MRNRLSLDFNLSSVSERTQFLTSYLESLPFKPTAAELETMSDYLLWGKDSSGKNGRQNGLHLKGTWDSSSHPTESLEGLLEEPTFQDTRLRPLNAISHKHPTYKISRTEIITQAPPILRKEFEDLWHRIDRTDYIVERYELQTGKRTAPIRKALLDALTDEERYALDLQAQSLEPYAALKLKRQLVELRREQYTLKDSFAAPIQLHNEPVYSESSALGIGDNIKVEPVGLMGEGPSFIWSHNLEPIKEEDAYSLINFLWKQNDQKDQNNQTAQNDYLLTLDLTKPEVLEKVFEYIGDLNEQAYIENNDLLKNFVRTIEFYIEEANLQPFQKDILRLKIYKRSNPEIVDFIKKKYEKTYNINYISTIFHKKIIGELVEAILLHREKLEALIYADEWKKCSYCGKYYLRDKRFFMRKQNSSDGLAARCKKCEKEIRDKKRGK